MKAFQWLPITLKIKTWPRSPHDGLAHAPCLTTCLNQSPITFCLTYSTSATHLLNVPPRDQAHSCLTALRLAIPFCNHKACSFLTSVQSLCWPSSMESHYHAPLPNPKLSVCLYFFSVFPFLKLLHVYNPLSNNPKSK